MKMKHILVPLALLLTIPFAVVQAADITKCIGMDVTGKTINVIIDMSTSTINVNGDVLKITSTTKNKKGMATENYQTEKGNTAYVSYMPSDENKDNAKLYQFNADTEKVISTVNLTCHTVS